MPQVLLNESSSSGGGGELLSNNENSNKLYDIQVTQKLDSRLAIVRRDYLQKGVRINKQ